MADRPLPLYRQNGWVRGLVHFHTRFSDGWGTVRRAAEIAKARDYDFLIVTDHLREIKLRRRRPIEEYIDDCDRATAHVGIPVIPGGEIEVHWARKGVDESEAHTIVFCVRDLVKLFDWTTEGKDPFWAWLDDEGHRGTIAAVQKMLHSHRIPRAASHQFQHSYLSTTPGEHPDYRYDLLRIPDADYLDFFYSGVMDATHEPEDIELISRFSDPQGATLKAVYASCDYHIGPEVVLPALDNLFRTMPLLSQAYRWLFTKVTSVALRRLAGNPEAAVFPYFADEQLTHSTYVHVGANGCTEPSILAGLRRGRTCVTRGTAEFAFLFPPPDQNQDNEGPARIQLELPKTWRPKFQRPHHVIVLRDGAPVHFEAYDIRSPDISFSWRDKEPLSGVHTYRLYVPSKFLGSPMRFVSRPVGRST